jgi:hypothetical protein
MLLLTLLYFLNEQLQLDFEPIKRRFYGESYCKF